MSRVRLFTDEDVYASVVVALRRHGFDAVSTPEVNRTGSTDLAQLEWAAQEGRALVTFNVADFARLHHEWMIAGRHHSGLIVSQQRAIGDIIRRLLHLGQTLTAENMADRLEYLSNW